MIPVSLNLRNFLSYGDGVPTLDFTRFRVACLTGDNGHGKSALIDAVTYALWGEARKGDHERKPDAGLLRIGADEMRVEFCFDLDDERFRVIRSFRKTRRTSSAQLDLQIFDSETDGYRSLTEGNSLSRTQQRIEQLLSMDYDTFINSAFIVQGKADEFTRKNARQRKDILGEILGLGRYDRLQTLARGHLQERLQEGQDFQRRLGELDVELADEPTYRQQLAETTRSLEEMGQAIETDEERLEKLREQRIERSRASQQLDELAHEETRLQERIQQLDREQEHLRNQSAKDAETLAARQEIERNFATYQQLRTRVSELDDHLQQVRNLESRSSRLEAQITQARHQVEQRCEKWNIRAQDLERRLEESAALLAQQQTTEARYAHLTTLRQQEQALERERTRNEELRGEAARLEHAIQLEQQSLINRRGDLENRIGDLRRRLEKGNGLQAELATAEQQLQSLQQQQVRRDHLREKGGGLRARIAQQQQLLARSEEELERAREKVHILKTSPDARCPLCGSELDEVHRGQLDQELARQELEQADRLNGQRREIEALEKELDQMRSTYQRLEEELESMEGKRQEQAALQARLARLQEDRIESGRLEEQLAETASRLKEARYAPQQRTRLTQVETELKRRGYSQEQHLQVREQLQELLPVEAEHARLQDARTQSAQLEGELKDAREKRDLARRYLEERLYAPQEQKELQEIARQREALAYDPEEHRRIRRQIDDLSEIVARRERLIAAGQRHAANEESIARNQAELDRLNLNHRELRERRERLAEQLVGLDTVERDFEALNQQLFQTRGQRDQLLQRQGTLQAQCSRCDALLEERKELREKQTANQRESWIYQQLNDAFGKDGIQALIIENAIPEIEKEANAILSRLTDNRIQIAIESLRDLKKGGTRETLDIKIADEVGERSYHLYSGGEAFRTNFALRIALSRVLAMRAGTRLRTLIIDEGFGTQDAQGLEQLVEAIQEISRDFDKVLVVTHLPALKNAFPVQIEVTKHPDSGSTYQIVENS